MASLTQGLLGNRGFQRKTFKDRSFPLETTVAEQAAADSFWWTGDASLILMDELWCITRSDERAVMHYPPCKSCDALPALQGL